MRTIAIILGGGKGERFSNKTFKQFLLISGRPLLYYTIKKFHSIEEIDEVVIVSHKDSIDDVKQIVFEAGFDKVRHVVEGGKNRICSTHNALNLFSKDEHAKVLIHDAVRPLIAESVIRKCIIALDTYPSCAVATPTTDTIFEVNDGQVLKIPDRKRMYLAQTPQGFHLPLIKEAYKKLKQEENSACFSDDCGVFMKYFEDMHVHVIEGNRENIKLTYPQDELYIKTHIEEDLKIDK